MNVKRFFRKLRTAHGIAVSVIMLGVLAGAVYALWSSPAEFATLGSMAMSLPLLGMAVATKSISEMKQERDALIKQQRNMLDKLEAENRQFRPDEQQEYKRNDVAIDRLDEDILAAEADLERRRKLAQKEISLMSGERKAYHTRVLDLADVDPEKEFRNAGELLFSLARFRKDGVRDDRLEALREQREQTMGTGATGGYALPAQFDATIRQIQAQEGIVRSRATVIPAGDPPDAQLAFPALDQTSATGNMYGGVTVVHTGEGVTMTETTAKLREVTFEPKEISAYIVVTNKLLANWQSAGAFTTRVLSQAMVGQEDTDFMRGDGVNKALGFVNSAAAITYARAGANAISFGDVTGMLARMLMKGGTPVWLASQTIIPQLAAMVDAGNHAVWLGAQAQALAGAAAPIPSTLLGFPLIWADRAPSLGSKGDLCLVNFPYYLIKDGSGPFLASSEHIFFLSNKTVFKILWNVDGHPWLTEPLQLEGDSTKTVSPFVVLQ
jgi:HK97 family phage major capsid protein